VLPVYFLELLMCPLAFLPLVYMVFPGNCLARVETQWAGDVACDFVAPNYECDVLSCKNLGLPFVAAINNGHCHCTFC
jgi:hypothetical protein